MKTTFRIITLFLGTLMYSCIDQLDFSTDSEEIILVVEGFITTQPGPHTIKLSRSARYGSVFQGIIRNIVNAKVIIRDQDGRTTVLKEKDFGEYLTPATFRGVVGNTYTLNIDTSEGKTYFSLPEIIQKVPKIDSLTLKFKKFPSTDPLDFVSGVEVYTHFQDPGDEKNYYMWENNGTYAFFAHPEDHVSLVFDLVPYFVANPLDCCSKCWFNDIADSRISIYKDYLSDGNYIGNMATFVEDNGERFMEKYLVRIQQFSITKEAYQFFALLNNQIGIDGDIFDPPPATLGGNIINLENPDEIAIGYFGAFDVSIDSIFIYREMLEDHQLSVLLNNDCRILENSTTTRPPYW